MSLVCIVLCLFIASPKRVFIDFAHRPERLKRWSESILALVSTSLESEQANFRLDLFPHRLNPM